MLQSDCESKKGLDCSKAKASWTRLESIYSVSGMTLIEVLVACCIVLIALYLVSRLMICSNNAVGHTGRRLAAVNLSRTQLERIRRTPYSDLPPEAVIIPASPTMYQGQDTCPVRLKNGNIIIGSLLIYDSVQAIPTTDYSADETRGILYFKPDYAGKNLTVAYRFLMPERTETLKVPASAPYRIRLFDKPRRGTTIAISSNDDIDPDSYSVSGRYVSFRRENAGQLVTISYIGDGFQSIVSGRHMSADLSTYSTTDNGNKEITLEQRWIVTHIKKGLKFTCLRTR